MEVKDSRPRLGAIFELALWPPNRKAVCLAISGLAVLLGSPTKVAGVSFAAPTSYPVGTAPAAIAVGDFNGDGKADMAVANRGSGDVSILLGNGDGTFQAAVNFTAGNSPNAIAVGDFNGDGKLDLAVYQTGVSVSILLGNGDGTFQAPKTLAFTATIGFMAVADFDGDKKSDLAMCDPANLNIFISKGDGTFQAAKTSAPPSGCRGLFTADFNGDSKPDLGLITANGLATGGIQILLGRGDGTFSTGALINYTGVHLPVIATDLNGDGKVDLVLSASQVFCQSGPPTVCQATVDTGVFLGNGDGTFQNGQSVTSLSFSVGVPPGGRSVRTNPVVGDFNGDGKLDLAYHVDFALVSGILLGRGDASFSSAVQDVPLQPGNAPWIAQDLNGDKLADLIAIGGTGANNIEVWLNTSPTSGADVGLLSTAVSAGPYVVGTNLTFTTDVLNQGPQDATGVTLTDTLPNGVTFVSATAAQGSCMQSNGVVTCNIGALASAFDSPITIAVTPTAVGTISNTMSVTANQADLVPGNNSATQTVTIVPVFALTVTDGGKGSGTVTSSPGAINCGATCSATYPQGTNVALTATPASGSIFSAWSGACTGIDPNSCTVAMNSAQSVTATFALAPDFTLASAPSTLTLKTGVQGTVTLTLTEQNGFSGQVNLSCAVTGPAPMATCGVSPSLLTLGASPANSTLTVTAPTSLSAFLRPLNTGSRLASVAAVMPVACLLWGGLGLASRRPRKRGSVLWVLGGSFFVLCMVAGCGGGSPPPPENYTITVTAASTSGTIQHSSPVTVTVE